MDEPPAEEPPAEEPPAEEPPAEEPPAEEPPAEEPPAEEPPAEEPPAEEPSNPPLQRDLLIPPVDIPEEDGTPGGPTANDDQYTVEENSGATSMAVTGNDEGNITSVMVTSPASHGEVNQEEMTTLLYTPQEGYVGDDSFTYQAKDANMATSNTATVTITVTPQGVTLEPVDPGQEFPERRLVDECQNNGDVNFSDSGSQDGCYDPCNNDVTFDNSGNQDGCYDPCNNDVTFDNSGNQDGCYDPCNNDVNAEGDGNWNGCYDPCNNDVNFDNSGNWDEDGCMHHGHKKKHHRHHHDDGRCHDDGDHDWKHWKNKWDNDWNHDWNQNQDWENQDWENQDWASSANEDWNGDNWNGDGWNKGDNWDDDGHKWRHHKGDSDDCHDGDDPDHHKKLPDTGAPSNLPIFVGAFLVLAGLSIVRRVRA